MEMETERCQVTAPEGCALNIALWPTVPCRQAKKNCQWAPIKKETAEDGRLPAWLTEKKPAVKRTEI